MKRSARRPRGPSHRRWPETVNQMIYLLGENTNGSQKLWDAIPRGIGRCYRSMTINPFAGEPWCFDNGAFSTWNRNGRRVDTDYTETFEFFESKLGQVGQMARDGNVPLFIVVPDRPGDGKHSLMVSQVWLDRWERNLKPRFDPAGLLPFYLAVQDGMSPEGLEASGVLNRIDGLFLGGTDEFKSTVKIWRELADKHGLKLHYGRCTQTKLAAAVAAGCDSADSSHPLRLAGKRWARFLEVFDAVVGTPWTFNQKAA